MKMICLQCKKEFDFEASKLKKGWGKFCSLVCRGISMRGKQSRNWRGGRKRTKWGYIEIYVPQHPYTNVSGYIKEHRQVMENKLVRYLEPSEVVHHINGIKDDNREENLGLISSAGKHSSLHLKGKVRTAIHSKRISESKKKIVHLLQRNERGQFIGGVTYA